MSGAIKIGSLRASDFGNALTPKPHVVVVTPKASNFTVIKLAYGGYRVKDNAEFAPSGFKDYKSIQEVRDDLKNR